MPLLTSAHTIEKKPAQWMDKIKHFPGRQLLQDFINFKAENLNLKVTCNLVNK